MADLPSPEFFALQQVVAGRYSIDHELGRGGMGVVFLARDVALDRLVAIKLLPPALAQSAELRQRFLREARAAARLSHPHIVPVHAVEEHDTLAFFVMAYVDGETLGDRVRRDGALPAHEALRVMQEVAWALAHAHAHGIAHRDVKPDNVMLERGTGRALVADFGIARLVDADTPGSGSPVGTPMYMSPEQASGEPGDARSDLYSLGATIYFAASGRPPFQGATALALLAQHVTAMPSPLPVSGGAASRRLAELVERCLAKDPAARPASAEWVAESLRAARASSEIAPPVRAYLREAESALSDAGTAVTASLVSLGVLLFHGSSPSLISMFAALVYYSIAGLAAAAGAVRLGQLAHATRSLARTGYGHAEVRSGAALQESERADEREASRARPGAGTWVRAGLGTAASAGLVWLSLQNVSGIPDYIATFGSVIAPTLTIRTLWNDLRRGPSLWSRLVSGRAGRQLFRAASAGVPRPALPSGAGQPTALVLERAADELFAALPAAERDRLAEIPSLVHKLRADAEAGADDPERRAGAVAALEALRLDLLRLHAGSAVAAPDLTRHIEEARRIGERIDARLELERTA